MPELSRAEILAYVAANVHRLRARKLTQQELEAKTGMGVQYIRKIERGSVNISLDTLRRLANALEVAPGLLLRKATLQPAKPGRPRNRSRPRSR